MITLLLQVSLQVCNAASSTAAITFKTDVALNTVRETYLSFNFIEGNRVPWTDPVLIKLVKNLGDASPMQLRIGGGNADDTMFTGAGGASGTCAQTVDNYSLDWCISASDWDDINHFIIATNAEFVWDLNLLTRYGGPASGGAWDPTNSVALLTQSVAKGYKFAGLQLGNEPEIYPKHRSFTISGAAVGADHATLQKLLQTSFPSFSTVPIYGPQDCCDTTGWFVPDFIAAASGSVSYYNFQHYPIHSCSLDAFLSIPTFRNMITFVQSAKSLVSSGVSMGGALKPITMGEFGSAYLGGCPGLSDRFISGFIYMSMLSTMAMEGVGKTICC